MAANLCCPIEMEPRTLNQGQLTHAREVAVDILHEKEPNEASDIFVEGLKPVSAIKLVKIVQKEYTLQTLDKGSEEKVEITETCCQCLCKSSIVESPDETTLKEPLSAPF